MRRIWIALAALAALGACATKYPGEPASAHDDERARDAFALQIDTGRVGVFNDRIAQALDLAPPAPAPANEAQDAAQAREYKIAADNLRQGWFNFLAVRARACAEGQFVTISCEPLAPPDWLSDSGQVKTDPDQIVRRLEDLQTAMGPLLDAACAQGKKLSKDETAEMFCSVE